MIGKTMTSGSDTTGVTIQYVNQTVECGFMMCNCGKHPGDRCEGGCQRQKEMLDRANAHLRSAMENMTKTLMEMQRMKRESELKLLGLTGEPYNKENNNA